MKNFAESCFKMKNFVRVLFWNEKFGEGSYKGPNFFLNKYDDIPLIPDDNNSNFYAYIRVLVESSS